MSDERRLLGALVGPIYDAVDAKAPAGREVAYYGLPYPAVEVPKKSVLYMNSKNKGRNMLRGYLIDEVARCGTDQSFVLVGYSQGAHVIGDVLSRKVGGLGPEILEQIRAVVLFGDPRFNSREDYARGSYRVGRRGVLGARSPGDLTAASGKIRSFCRLDDIVCQSPGGSTRQHHAGAYLGEHRKEAVNFIARRLGWNQPEPQPEPPPRTEPLSRGDVCSERLLGELAGLLWNRWFDEGADPASTTPGYLFYARDVLHEFAYSGGAAWSLKPGVVLLRGYDPSTEYAAFEYLPNDHRGDLIGIGVVASSSGLIGAAELHASEQHEGQPSDQALAGHLSKPAIALDAWDGTSGRLALRCA